MWNQSMSSSLIINMIFEICYDNYGGVSNHKFSYGNSYSQLKLPIIFYAF